MLRNFILAAVATVALATLACSFTVDLPVEKVVTGPDQTVAIDIAAPQAEVVDLSLEFGAGELTLAPGAGGKLVTGQVVFNVEDLRPTTKVDGSSVLLKSGNLEFKGIPDFDTDEVKNEWDLKLGEALMNLKITAGAYKGVLELGGLALKSLEVGDGASEVSLRFSEPNQAEMVSLRYSTGASSVKLYGLAYANFASMIFRGGAGDYLLDFSGDLQRDAAVTVEAGVSKVTIVVPTGTSARVVFEGGLSDVFASGGWEKSGNQYTLEGSGPQLVIKVNIAAGQLELRTSE